jgi:hypothetical protein
MAREQRSHLAVIVERLEGRELTTSLSLSGSGAGLARVERQQVEVRAVTAGNAVAAVNYLMTTGYFMS